MTDSCVYEGWIRHRRHGDVEHELRFPLFMAYLDLAELPGSSTGCRLWSARRPAAAWFRREPTTSATRRSRWPTTIRALVAAADRPCARTARSAC